MSETGSNDRSDDRPTDGGDLDWVREPGDAGAYHLDLTSFDARLALQRAFILGLALTISAVFLWMISGFLSALFVAGVLTVFLLPLQNGIAKLLGGRRGIAASITLLIALILLVLPILGILGLVAEQAVTVSAAVIPWVQERAADFQREGMEGMPDWVPFREVILTYQGEIAEQLTRLAGAVGNFLIGALQRATGETVGFLLDVFVMLFALFFFLMSGDRAARESLTLLPMSQQNRETLAERTLSTIRATVKGTFVIALVQGTLTGVGLAVAGVPGAAFWGMVAAFLSVIPGVGPPLVWLPAAIWLGVEGDIVAGAGLALYGALIVGVIDNVLRPYLVGRDAKMSDLMVLLSTLGGLTLFGFIGIVIGPVIAALFVSVWYLYRQAYAPLLHAED